MPGYIGTLRSKSGRIVKYFSKHALKEKCFRTFPILTWLPQYKIADLRYDIIAGLTVGLTMVPQAIAYAEMANINPQYGLYSCFIGQLLYVVMGTSKDVNIGPSAILSVLTGQISAEIMPNQLLDRGDPTCATLMAFFCGLIMMMMGVGQLGFLVNLFSIPVVAGFTSAAGFAIFASQVSNFFGISTVVFRPPGVFVKEIKAVVEKLQLTNFADLIVGVSCLSFILFMQYLPRIVNKMCCQKGCRRSTRDKRAWQNFLEVLRMLSASRNVIVFFVSTGVAYQLNQTSDFKITTVGRFVKGFPKFTPPKFYLSNGTEVLSPTPDEEDFLVSGDEPIVLRPAVDLLEVMSPGFLIISLMASMELFVVTKALGRKNNYRVDASQELMVVGLANFIQSFAHGFPVTGAVTRSALADQCRVKTQLGGLISATVVMIAVGALIETFQFIPKACLSAIIIGACVNLIDFSIVRSMWRQYRQDIFLYFTTFIICLFWDIAYGVLLCLLLNIITFLRPVVRMKIHVEEQAGVEGKDLIVVKLSQGMRYPSADKFTDRISNVLSRDDDKHIVIDCQFVTHVDYTGLQAFRNLLLAAVQKSKHVIFTNLNEKIQKHLATVGMEHFKYVSSVDEAVRMYNVKTSTPAVRFVSSGDEEAAGSDADEGGEMSFEAENAVENPRLLRALSIQPSFYGDIKLTVGNISKVDKDSTMSNKVKTKTTRVVGSAPPIVKAVPVGTPLVQPRQQMPTFSMVMTKPSSTVSNVKKPCQLLQQQAQTILQSRVADVPLSKSTASKQHREKNRLLYSRSRSPNNNNNNNNQLENSTSLLPLHERPSLAGGASVYSFTNQPAASNVVNNKRPKRKRPARDVTTANRGLLLQHHGGTSGDDVTVDLMLTAQDINSP